MLEVSARPSFRLTVPDRNPRTLWDCQPVADISSPIVAPSTRLSSVRHCSNLLTLIADLDPFRLAGAAAVVGRIFGLFFAALGCLAVLAGLDLAVDDFVMGGLHCCRHRDYRESGTTLSPATWQGRFFTIHQAAFRAWSCP